MPYVTLLEASQIVKNETGIDITVPQLIRAGAMQHLMLCVLLDVKCYSPTHRIRREKRALELDPDYWSNCPIDRIDDADVVDAYGLFVLPPRHVFAYQTKETVRVDSVASLDGLDIYFPGVYVSRDALQITMPHLDAFIKHIKATQATASRVEAATEPVRRPLRKAQLIAELERQWPTIENDLKEISRGGIYEGLAASRVKHGVYDAHAATAWAIEHARMRAPGAKPNSVFSIAASRIHKIE